MERKIPASHLTDEELFPLALPPIGEPEALPSHLLECLRCARALREWKSAIREIGEEDENAIVRRTPEQWRVAEERTLEAVRRARPRRRVRALPWIAGLAASLLLFALVLPARRHGEPAGPAAQARSSAPSSPPEGLSPQDSADDTLLREVARLARGEDGGTWNRLAPDPAASAAAPRKEDAL